MYSLFSLPHGFKFDQLTRQQARENLRAVVERIPERLGMLESLVRLELPAWRADYSEESLATLGEWYVRHVEERPVMAQETVVLKRQMGPGLEFIAEGQIELTRESYSIGIDVGLYIAECIRSRCPRTVWGVELRSKSYIYYNKPVLSGFTHRHEYSPIGMAGFGVSFVRSRRQVDIPPEEKRTPAQQLAAGLASIPPRNPKTMFVNIMKDLVGRSV